jgi:cell wall-associated NlpC family hydrolase
MGSVCSPLVERLHLRQCLTFAMLLLTLVMAAAPSVHLEASVDGGKRQTAWVYARVGAKVTLHAVLSAGLTAQAVRWFKVEPTVGAIDNTTPSFHFEPVSYAELELPACAGALACVADVAPSHLAPVAALPGVGTMGFRVEVKTRAGTLSTAGMESTQYGGLSRDVFRVTLRRDDTLIGYATELINTPYIFGSAGPDGRNQSDLLIGSDCADLIIYARRRAGKKAEYTSSYAIDRQAPELKPGVKARAGDLVHFPSMRHVAILYEDREPLGVVDEGDLIFHTCWAPPTVQRIGDTACVAPPYRVLRFKE